MIYRYIGATTEIDYGRIKLETLGQKVTLDDATAKSVILGGGPILPEAEYAALNITPAEEKTYAWPALRHSASSEFKAKLAKGFVTYQRLVADLEAGKPLTTPAAEVTKPAATPEVKK